MKKIHILSPGFISPNAIAFLFPLFFNLERLKDIGIFFQLFNSIKPEIHDCDFLIIDSRFYSKKWTHSNDQNIFDELLKLRERIGCLAFFDISDSTGWVQSQVLPFVDYYYKSQLHSDLTAYKKKIYGNLVFPTLFCRLNISSDISVKIVSVIKIYLIRLAKILSKTSL